MTKRKNWIDWMKAIGMLFIVWGHLFPELLTCFVYAFNVPVFFIVSGMLGKTGKCDRSIISKLFKSLALPYIIICSTYLILNIIFLYLSNDLSVVNYLRSIIYMIAGFQSCPHGIGAMAMWFLYTLLIIKIIFSILDDWRLLGILSLICIIGSLACKGHSLFWSVQNVLLALPFYYFGWLLNTRGREWFEMTTEKLKLYFGEHKIKAGLLATFGFLVVFFIGRINGFAKMYACDYGNNIGLFYAGGLLGSFVIYLLSLCLDNVVLPWVKTLSVGSIVILGYQYLPIKVYGLVMMWKHLSPYKNNDVLTFLVSVLIMWTFVYIIQMVRRFCPAILGGRKCE